MAEVLSTSKINGDSNATVQKLHGVIRALIAEKSRLEKPLLATKRLAKYCQNLRKENERLKERAYNFEVGMTRAERRSAQLKHDLQKAQGSAPSNQTSPKQAQFYLPSSIQLLIDSLTTQNVILMKSLNKATNNPKGADLIEENKKLDDRVKALEDEIAMKEEIIEQFRSFVVNAADDEAIEKRMFEQLNECAELKKKLRNYHNYVRHLRERNTAIMNSVMEEFNQRSRIPVEMNDDVVTDLSDEGATSSFSRCSTCSNSVEGSRNASRRVSLKDSDVQTEPELLAKNEALIAIQDMVDFVRPNSMLTDSSDWNMEATEHQDCCKAITELKGQINEQTSIINAKLAKEESLEKSMFELRGVLKTLSLENNDKEQHIRALVDKLDVMDMKNKELEEQQQESEQILNLMQERVDEVNMHSQDTEKLRQELNECHVELQEKKLMQTVLQQYEEQIKAYSQERNELVKSKAKLEQELNVQKKKGEQTAYTGGHAQQHAVLRRNLSHRKMKEPYQYQAWESGNYHQQVVVADGRGDAHCSSNERTQQYPHQSGVGASMQYSSDVAENLQLTPEEAQERRDYIERGTVKCENCGERFPLGLFQDHFRDCARDNSI